MPRNRLHIPQKVGLALGSGSARGWAHIGVLRALAEAGITIQYVAGTSIGALVGAAYALGKINELEAFARRLDWKHIVSFLDVTVPISGLIDGNKLTALFRELAGDIPIEDLPLPFRAVATDLLSGREVVLTSGELVSAVRASISIPGIFTPVKRDGRFLVDGGLLNPVPVSVVRNMGAEYVIAVDLHDPSFGANTDLDKQDRRNQTLPAEDEGTQEKVNTASKLAKTLTGLSTSPIAQVREWMSSDSAPSIFDVVINSINIMESRITAIRMATDPPDLLFHPRLGDIRSLEFHRAEEAIAAGYLVASERLHADRGDGKR